MNNKFPLEIWTFNGQRFGLSWTINFPIFFTKFEEIVGIDIQPLVVSLLLRLIRMEIKSLENSRELESLTKERELDLKNYQAQEKKLTTWLKATNHG